MRDPNPNFDEVRAVCDALAKEYDYDIAKIAEAVRAREVKSGRTFLLLPPRKPLIREMRGDLKVFGAELDLSH